MRAFLAFADTWQIAHLSRPWGDRPAIYDHIRRYAWPGQPGLVEAGMGLPDRGRLDAEYALTAVARAAQARLTPELVEPEAATAFRWLQQVLEDEISQPLLDNFYHWLVDCYPASLADGLLARLQAWEELPAERLHVLGCWLAERAADRGAVAVGVLLLGLQPATTEAPAERELLLALGRHPYFTHLVAGVFNNAPDREDALWALGQVADDLGRLHPVGLLAGTTNPAIRRWLLLQEWDDFFPCLMTAYLRATSGDLLGALQSEPVSNEVLLAAGRVLRDLVQARDGSMRNIWHYGDGPAAMLCYLSLLRQKSEQGVPTLEQFHILLELDDFLGEVRRGWHQAGWDQQLRHEAHRLVHSLMTQPHWPALALAGMRSADPDTFYEAADVAHALGIDTWSERVAWLRRRPANATGWFELGRVLEDGRLDDLLALAYELLPPERPLSPIPEPDEEGVHWLEALLEILKAYPGRGADYVLAALASPRASHRLTAVDLLRGWDRRHWPDGALAALRSWPLPQQPNDLVGGGVESGRWGEARSAASE